MPAPTEKDEEADLEVQVAKIVLTDVPDKLDELLRQQPTSTSTNTDDLVSHQLANPSLEPIILYLKGGKLPENGQQAQEIIVLSKQFTIFDEMLYRENSKCGDLPQIVVPASLKQQMMEEHHAGSLAGHFSGPRLYETISRRRWWKNMYRDLIEYSRKCPQCTVVERKERKKIPPLMPIPVDHLFQIMGVDIIEPPLTTKGNKYLIFSKTYLQNGPWHFPHQIKRQNELPDY